VAFEKIKSSCDNPLCPTCAASWCGREARNIEGRIKALIEFYRKQGIVVTCEHVVVSPHPDSPEASKWLISPEFARARANEAMRKRGIVGGADILHAHRVRSYQRAFLEGKVAGRYVAPHVHVLALFFGEGNGYKRCRDCKSVSSLDCLACQGFEGTTRRQYLKDKLIVKVAEARSEGDSDFTVDAVADMENRRSLASSRSRKGTRKTLGGTAAYQLSHAAVEVSTKRNGRNHVVSWWGIASYRQFKMDDPERTVRLCPVCNCEMELSRYVGSKGTAPKNDKGLNSLFDERGMARWIPVDANG
jgi:hypothetical protein